MGTWSFPGIKSGRGVTLTPHLLLVPWSRKSRAIPLLPLWAVRPVQSLSACTMVHFTSTTVMLLTLGHMHYNYDTIRIRRHDRHLTSLLIYFRGASCHARYRKEIYIFFFINLLQNDSSDRLTTPLRIHYIYLQVTFWIFRRTLSLNTDGSTYLLHCRRVTCRVQLYGILHCSGVKIQGEVQEKMSIFWAVTASIIAREKAHVNMCLILDGYRDRDVWI